MIRKAIRFALLVVMLGSGRVTAQVTEGFYRIVSTQDNTYYLCPAQDPDDPSVGYWVDGNLMLTTKKNPPADYTVWRLSAGSGDNGGFFQLIHQASGHYIINDKTDRVAEAIHLGSLPVDDADTWFGITFTSSYYNIKGKAVTGSYSFNPYNGNQNTYTAASASNTGIIGYWDANVDGSKWQLIEVVPDIAVSGDDFSITFPVSATIYYTTDDSDPTSSATRHTYSSAFQLTGGDYKVRAVAVADGVTSGEATHIVTCAQTHITDVSGLAAIDGSTAAFIITGDIDVSTLTTIASFGGTLEAAINPATHMPYRLTGLTQPLFATLTGTVRNMVLDEVGISGHSGNTGAVLVSPRIAKGEQAIMDEAVRRGYPVALVADNGFPDRYHPSAAQLDLCAAGRLLLVTPWSYRYRGRQEAITVPECKTMNCIAQSLCHKKDSWWKTPVYTQRMIK